MMAAIGSIALIALCEPAFSQAKPQPLPQAKPKVEPKAAQQTAQTRNKSLARHAGAANANRLRSTAISAPPKAPLPASAGAQ